MPDIHFVDEPSLESKGSRERHLLQASAKSIALKLAHRKAPRRPSPSHLQHSHEQVFALVRDSDEPLQPRSSDRQEGRNDVRRAPSYDMAASPRKLFEDFPFPIDAGTYMGMQSC